MTKLDAPKRRGFTPHENLAILRRYPLERVPVADPCDEFAGAPNVFCRWQRKPLERGARVNSPQFVAEECVVFQRKSTISSVAASSVAARATPWRYDRIPMAVGDSSQWTSTNAGLTPRPVWLNRVPHFQSNRVFLAQASRC